jgi:clan AA aspartic protease (TIGR02281 family)
MKRFLTALLSMTGVALVHMPNNSPLLAQTSEDGLCYMVGPSGRVVNLNRLCGGGTSTPASTTTPNVFQVPIKYRLGGTPVIEVTFNNGRKFDMILDTGASGVVITSQMATALGVRAVGKVIASTPSNQSAEFDVGFVNTINVGGVVVRNVRVAIAPELEVGLLGQNFFGNYDVTIRSNVVEFHVR